jgi:serine/threonine protein kinase/tetratricopeptide (TPR) repeat protein
MPPPSDHAPLAPSRGRIGPYAIRGLLGQGGMAAVYLAEDTRDGRQVAVKVLARMRPSWVHRFQREFEAARRVDHPNVVKVLEAGEHDGTAYFSMERVLGVTAQRYVLRLGAEDPLPPAPPMEGPLPPMDTNPQLVLRTIAVGIQLTRAVAAIHRVGLVHRDLKPGNVLVTHEGVVKLVDFGVAKWLEEQSQFTQVGHVVGSYSYMSPEQITGAEVDHRADTYGMGVLLYELLSGAPPFRARRPQEYLWLHCTAQPEPLSRRMVDFPAGFDGLLMEMLQKEPADRPESMALIERRLLDLQAEIEGAAAGASLELADAEPEVPDPEDPSEVRMRRQDETLLALRRRARQTSSGESTPAPDPLARLAADLSEELALPDEQVRSLHRPQAQRLTQSSAALAALVTPRHVGRKAELDALLGELKRVRREGARAVVIEAGEGLGKTRLLETFRGLAWVKGARVAIGRCHSTGAFCGPFHDIMLRLAGPGLARSHSDKILGGDAELLRRFFPALGSRGVPSGATGASLAAGLDDPSAIYRAVGEAFRRAASEAPLVIGLEDAHRADGGTARLVRSLLTRLGTPTPARVLLVITCRPEETAAAGDPTLVRSLAGHERVLHQSLRPLTDPETKDLIRSVTGDLDLEESLLERLAEAAHGNPRFAVEAARSVVESGGITGDAELPRSLRAAFTSRLENLGKAARDVARCIALVGELPPLAIVQSAAGLSSEAFTEAVSELERRRVVTVHARENEPETIGLASDALRTTVLDSLSASQARTLHRRAAAAWLTAGPSVPGGSAQAARHLFAAGESGAAFPHALEAAYQAGQQLDYASARRWMAQISEAADDHLEAVSEEAVHRFQMLSFRLAFMDGELDVAREAIQRAARAAPDARSRLETGVALARFHTRTGNYVGAVQVSRGGLREARQAELPDLAVLFATQGARAARRSGDIESALAWLAEADLLLRQHGQLEPLAVRVAWTRSAVLLELHRGGEAEPEILRAIELARATHQERAEAGLRTNLSVLHWRRGELSAAVEQVEQARRIFEGLGELDQVALTDTNLAELRVKQAQLGAAREHARRAWTAYRRLRDRQGTLVAAATALMVARVVGDSVLADDVLRAIGDGPKGGRGVETEWAEYWLERARRERLAQRPAGAHLALDHAQAALGSNPPAYRAREVHLERAELLLDEGRVAEAHRLLRDVVKGAEDEQHLPVAWYARAVLAAAEARSGGRPELLAPPKALLADNLHLALATLTWHAEALSAMGELEEARSLRERGAALARQRGFADWLQRLA